MRGLACSGPLLILALNLAGCGAIAARPDASVGDMPSKGPVGRTMKAHSGEFAACARDAVTVQTGTVQHLQLHFVVDAKGKVQKARIAEMNDPDPDLYSCVLKTLKHMEFPPPKDGEPHNVDYPLVLKPE